MPHTKPSLESTLTRAWLRRGAARLRAVAAVAAVPRAVGAARCACSAPACWQSTRLPVPVVVVGNIFIGGTGKTPLTIWLAEALRAAGFTPGDHLARPWRRGRRAARGHARFERAAKSATSRC